MDMDDATLQGLSIALLIVTSAVFWVTGFRMLIIRPKWTSGYDSQPSRMWKAVTALMFILALITIRDVVQAMETDSVYWPGRILRIMKLIGGLAVLLATFSHETKRRRLP